MTVTEQPSATEHRIVYIIAGVAVVVLTIIALLTYSSGKSSEQADQKANQFVAAVTAAGGRAPSKEQVVRLFGTTVTASAFSRPPPLPQCAPRAIPTASP